MNSFIDATHVCTRLGEITDHVQDSLFIVGKIKDLLKHDPITSLNRHKLLLLVAQLKSQLTQADGNLCGLENYMLDDDNVDLRAPSPDTATISTLVLQESEKKFEELTDKLHDIALHDRDDSPARYSPCCPEEDENLDNAFDC